MVVVFALVPAASLGQDRFPRQPSSPPQPPASYQPRPDAFGSLDVQRLEQLARVERQEYGVPPTARLYSGRMHGPTPASIPGGQVITTLGLLDLLGNNELGTLVFDVLGGPQKLPGAILAVPAHQPGSFNDATQNEFGRFLRQVTNGNVETPLVFYCQSTHCWMSYNAALRAINMGYRNVLWYRGGLEAWQAAGQRTDTQ